MIDCVEECFCGVKLPWMDDEKLPGKKLE